MLDLCANCLCRGDIGKCESVECSHHDSWYILSKKKDIKMLADADSMGEHSKIVRQLGLDNES